jgi:ABC-type branched-subunit amino acid transport system substrate-binding protein
MLSATAVFKRIMALGAVMCLVACTNSAPYERREAKESERALPPASAYEATHSTEVPAAAQRMSAEARKNLPVVKVGLLVPFSGKSASLGSAFMDAAMQALFDRYNRSGDMRVKVEIVAKDTKGTALGAQTAAQEAIAEGVGIILGPLYTESVNAVAAVATARRIPMITFSNNRDVANPGVYVFGFVTIQQV